MNNDLHEPLPDDIELALAWTPHMARAPLRNAFALDQRLAGLCARTREPVLGQMRLAWWRDMLGKPAAQRPRGDAVLDGLAVHWAGREVALIAMVDGWEVMVSAERLGRDDAVAFAAGRSAFLAVATTPISDAADQAARLAAMRWALADAAARMSDPHERAVLIEAGLALGRADQRLPGPMRGLAVLGSLAARALANGGRPLLEGKGAALTALKAGLLRR